MKKGGTVTSACKCLADGDELFRGQPGLEVRKRIRGNEANEQSDVTDIYPKHKLCSRY